MTLRIRVMLDFVLLVALALGGSAMIFHPDCEESFRQSTYGSLNAIAPVRAEIIGDQGRGILVENQEKIFEPFFTTKESGKGMRICDEIIKKHGGEIRVVSEVGQGPTFTSTLPIHGERDADV